MEEAIKLHNHKLDKLNHLQSWFGLLTNHDQLVKTWIQIQFWKALGVGEGGRIQAKNETKVMNSLLRTPFIFSLCFLISLFFALI